MTLLLILICLIPAFFIKRRLVNILLYLAGLSMLAFAFYFVGQYIEGWENQTSNYRLYGAGGIIVLISSGMLILLSLILNRSKKVS